MLFRSMGADGLARAGVAALAPVVAAAADDGDAAAADILGRAGRELADHARALRNTLRFAPDEPAALSWSGGVLTGVPRVREAFARALEDTGGFALVEPRYPPAIGAALHALRLGRAGAERERQPAR